MDKDNLVSVIIPTFNNETTIIRCIESVVAQNYSDIEIVIINDGSKDDTDVIVRQYIATESSNNRIRYIKKDNSGPSETRNIGIRETTGEFIAFLDADDEWLPHKLEKQIAFLLKNQNVALAAGAFECKRIDSDVESELIGLKKLLFKNYFFTPVVVLRRSMLNGLCFNTKQHYSEDYRLWLTICATNKCLYINDVMAKNQIEKPTFGQSGLSSRLWEMELGELSNYLFLYKEKHINFIYFTLASSYSLLRFIRRWLITKMR